LTVPFVELEGALGATPIAGLATIETRTHSDHALTGTRFEVRTAHEAHPHRSFSEIRTFLDSLDLVPARKAGRAVYQILRQVVPERRVIREPRDRLTPQS